MKKNITKRYHCDYKCNIGLYIGRKVLFVCFVCRCCCCFICLFGVVVVLVFLLGSFSLVFQRNREHFNTQSFQVFRLSTSGLADIASSERERERERERKREREREMFYLTTHSTHFIYGYMASDIWLRTILIVRKETRCRHIGYSYRLTARVLLYAPSHRQDNTYHSLCYTSRGALAGTKNSSMGPPHEGSIRRPTAP